MRVRNRFSAEKVTIVTGARLHLGFYAFEDTDRVYGGLGLAVTKPSYLIKAVETGEGVSVEGCQASEAEAFFRDAVKLLGIRGVKAEIAQCIPRHVGLGSTTQLALAAYTAVSILAGRKPDIYELARLSGRGRVSGIGVAAFRYGGFIVDAGRPAYAPKDYVVKPLTRITFPQKWVAVILVPRTGWRISEEVEDELFSRAGGLDDKDRSRLLYIVFRKLIPAIIDEDFQSFTSALEEVQRLTGQYFSGAQEGIFCCREAERAAEALKAAGARGVGQSSWGPLVYGFYPNLVAASKGLRTAKYLLEAEGIELLLADITRPRNSGAKIMVSKS